MCKTDDLVGFLHALVLTPLMEDDKKIWATLMDFLLNPHALLRKCNWFMNNKISYKANPNSAIF